MRYEKCNARKKRWLTGSFMVVETSCLKCARGCERALTPAVGSLSSHVGRLDAHLYLGQDRVMLAIGARSQLIPPLACALQIVHANR